jgi:hypothetical protein
MIKEALVVLACAKGQGCPETASLYYQDSLELQAAAAVLEHKVRYYTPEFIINYCAPLALLATGNKGVLKLHKNAGLELERDRALIFYRLEL